MTNTNANVPTVTVAEVASRKEQQADDRHYTTVSAPEATIIIGCATLVFTVFGWIVVNYLQLRREREDRAHTDLRERQQRKATLLQTLKHWENTLIVITDPDEIKRRYYSEGMRGLAEAVELFRHHVADQSTFDKLNHAMSQIDPVTLDANGRDGRRDMLCGAIRKFYDFIRAS